MEEVRSERGRDVVIILVGNKNDLTDKRYCNPNILENYFSGRFLLNLSAWLWLHICMRRDFQFCLLLLHGICKLGGGVVLFGRDARRAA